MEGSPEAVMDYYNALIAERETSTVRLSVTDSGKVQTISGTGEAVVTHISLLDQNQCALDTADVGQDVTLRIDVETHEFIEKLVLGYGLKDRLGQVVYGTNTHLKDQVLHNVAAHSRIRFEFSFPLNVGPGGYSIQTALSSSQTHLENNYEWKDLALVFNVINTTKHEFAGCNWLDPKINIAIQ
jgi:lipopolysaccharide transport system ATP-binding protein